MERVLTAIDLAKLKDPTFYAITVSGDYPNKWGHALLNFGNHGGLYVQVAGQVVARPELLTQHEYDVYLAKNQKKEIRRDYVYMPHPDRALALMGRLIEERWLWLGVIHNCTTFVERILTAGGANYQFPMNMPCPTFDGCPK